MIKKIELEEILKMKKKIFKIILTVIAAVFSFNIYATSKKIDVIFSNSEIISTEKVNEIMFEHARIDRKKVRITKIMLDIENRKYFYNIEFFTEEYKYIYNIDAHMGHILKHSRKTRRRNLPKEKKQSLWDILGF